jgi:hypothetical protein
MILFDPVEHAIMEVSRLHRRALERAAQEEAERQSKTQGCDDYLPLSEIRLIQHRAGKLLTKNEE